MPRTATPTSADTTVREEVGIQFPAGSDGTRPTTPTVKAIVAEAVRNSDPALASRVEADTSWRQGYVGAMRELTVRTAADDDAATTIARDGLAAARAHLVHVANDGTQTPLADLDVDAAVDAARGTFGTHTVDGTAEPRQELAIPYQGRMLSGHDLERQLAAWVHKGIVEQSCADAVMRVVAHPEWLSLPGHVVADIGAGAEMGPLEMLSSWGARILAIDIPRVSERLEKMARDGAGHVSLPTKDGETGADITRDTAAVAAWIDEQAGDDTVVLGMHAYADSGMHIRLTLAADLIATWLQERRPTTVLAYLATPTDAFVVPQEIIDAARSRWSRHGSKGFAKRALRTASRGQLFTEPYPKGSRVTDCIIAQQGPNYAVAKRLQRWRAVASEADGRRVSFNVAPATFTRSVTKNTALKAAYAGAHHFGVEVFAAETSRALMAALLVHDVMRDDLAPGAAPQRAHAEELFSDGAAHGGLWRTAWAPRSALGVAAALGAPKALRRKA